MLLLHMSLEAFETRVALTYFGGTLRTSADPGMVLTSELRLWSFTGPEISLHRSARFGR
jgi:hypothetical protein